MSWKVLDGGVEKRVREDASGIFFGTGQKPKRVQVFAVVTYLYVVKEGDGPITEAAARTAFLYAEVIVGDAPADPGQNPTPPAPPAPQTEPTFAQGKFGLAKFTYDIVKNKAPVGQGNVAAALAQNYKNVVDAIKAGKLKSPTDITKAARDANRQTLSGAGGNVLEAWKPVLEGIGEQLFSLQGSGLTTAEAFADAYLEISQGLEASK